MFLGLEAAYKHSQLRYGGMMGMGMGMGSSYAESMFRMTQMLEMNSIMLEQLQEHVTFLDDP